MRGGACGDLRRMRDRQNLHPPRQPRQTLPDGIRDSAADAGVDLVEDQVGAEPRSASATFSASRKRDSSPPDATFIIGPARVPGLVRTQNSTVSIPSSSRSRRRWKVRR